MSRDILRILNAAAEAGEPCPTNREIAAAVGLTDPSTVTKALHRLTCTGDIRQDRFNGRRCVTIVRTGKAILSAEQTREGKQHENRREAHSGLTPAEIAVMDLWDTADLGTAAIAHQLGRPRKTIDRIVTTYDGRADHAEFCRTARDSSAQLLAAIARHFPERIAA
jgi:DNA-binding MarR family transcriptional regulator